MSDTKKPSEPDKKEPKTAVPISPGRPMSVKAGIKPRIRYKAS